MTNAMKLSRLGLLAILLLPACMEEFDPPSLLKGMRPLGAQVSVVGDETRSTPAPGETVTVDWLMAVSEEPPAVAWGFLACTTGGCVPAATGNDLPIRFSYAVPADLTDTRVQLVGLLCLDSGITVDEGQVACAGGDKGVTMTVDVVMAVDGTQNRIPNLAARVFTFDGAPWNDGDACEALPTVALGTKDHAITVWTLAEDRETYVALQGDPPAPVSVRETLQISNFSTDGALSRSFSFIEADAPAVDTEVAVTWDAPTAGDRVTFHFVARDYRGGVSLATRTVCLQ